MHLLQIGCERKTVLYERHLSRILLFLIASLLWQSNHTLKWVTLKTRWTNCPLSSPNLVWSFVYKDKCVCAHTYRNTAKIFATLLNGTVMLDVLTDDVTVRVPCRGQTALKINRLLYSFYSWAWRPAHWHKWLRLVLILMQILVVQFHTNKHTIMYSHHFWEHCADVHSLSVDLMNP